MASTWVMLASYARAAFRALSESRPSISSSFRRRASDLQPIISWSKTANYYFSAAVSGKPLRFTWSPKRQQKPSILHHSLVRLLTKLTEIEPEERFVLVFIELVLQCFGEVVECCPCVAESGHELLDVVSSQVLE